ncbi:MAG: hypothetical protein HQL64_16455 [Magnetococcales bacterium]|nr:hypothetical protein [Magnetococcales bacterium]
MINSIIYIEVFPFLTRLAMLMGATILGDFILHRFGLVWVGRYMGIPGTLLIVLSLLYSLRKRKIIHTGSPRILLRVHEFFTWLGALMILIHSGVHFNAILPWLATMAMVVNVVSGLVGQYLLERSRRHLSSMRKQYQVDGMAKNEIEMALYWDSVTYDLMVKWRIVHFPISYAFSILAIGHIFSVFLFWEWK